MRPRLLPFVLAGAVALTAAEARSQELVRADNPTRGPAGAPVTVVQFCDFQCPFCAESQAVVAQVLAAYPREVQLVFRNFPLDNSHPDATRAAAAAACAQEQGRFWPMHDAMLANQGELHRNGLTRLARAAGLDAVAFDRCLDSGRRRFDWRRDVEDGTALGVSGTPTWFVNGQPVEGAGFADLDALIRAALGR